MQRNPNCTRGFETSPPITSACCIPLRLAFGTCDAKLEFKYGVPVPLRKYRQVLRDFDIAIDVVDGEDNFVQTKDRNVDCYICCECDRQISYEDFMRGAAARTALS